MNGGSQPPTTRGVARAPRPTRFAATPSSRRRPPRWCVARRARCAPTTSPRRAATPPAPPTSRSRPTSRSGARCRASRAAAPSRRSCSASRTTSVARRPATAPAPPPGRRATTSCSGELAAELGPRPDEALVAREQQAALRAAMTTLDHRDTWLLWGRVVDQLCRAAPRVPGGVRRPSRPPRGCARRSSTRSGGPSPRSRGCPMTLADDDDAFIATTLAAIRAESAAIQDARLDDTLRAAPRPAAAASRTRAARRPALGYALTALAAGLLAAAITFAATRPSERAPRQRLRARRDHPWPSRVPDHHHRRAGPPDRDRAPHRRPPRRRACAVPCWPGHPHRALPRRPARRPGGRLRRPRAPRRAAHVRSRRRAWPVPRARPDGSVRASGSR